MLLLSSPSKNQQSTSLVQAMPTPRDSQHNDALFKGTGNKNQKGPAPALTGAEQRPQGRHISKPAADTPPEGRYPPAQLPAARVTSLEQTLHCLLLPLPPPLLAAGICSKQSRTKSPIHAKMEKLTFCLGRLICTVNYLWSLTSRA